MKLHLGVLLAFCFLLVPALSPAVTISVSLPDFDGPFQPTGYPYDFGVIGTFTYAIPAGSTITSASFSGTHGTAALPSSTAGFDAVIGGQTITVCAPFAGCWTGMGSLVPFSFNLAPSTYSTLLTGSAGLGIIQTNDYIVRLGTPTLTIDYTSVPEPSSAILLGLGLAAGFAARRRLRRA